MGGGEGETGGGKGKQARGGMGEGERERDSKGSPGYLALCRVGTSPWLAGLSGMGAKDPAPAAAPAAPAASDAAAGRARGERREPPPPPAAAAAAAAAAASASAPPAPPTADMWSKNGTSISCCWGSSLLGVQERGRGRGRGRDLGVRRTARRDSRVCGFCLHESALLHSRRMA